MAELESYKYAASDILEMADSGILSRGNLLFLNLGVWINLLKADIKQLRIEVPSESSRRKYLVVFSRKNSEISARCECPAYSNYDRCKHIIAACNYIIESFAEQKEEEGKLENARTYKIVKSTEQNSNELKVANGAVKQADVKYEFKVVAASAELLERLGYFGFDENVNLVVPYGTQFLQKVDLNVYQNRVELTYNYPDVLLAICKCNLPKPCFHMEQAGAYLGRKYGSSVYCLSLPLEVQDQMIEKEYPLVSKERRKDFRFGLDSKSEAILIRPKWLLAGKDLETVARKFNTLGVHKSLKPIIREAEYRLFLAPNGSIVSDAIGFYWSLVKIRKLKNGEERFEERKFNTTTTELEKYVDPTIAVALEGTRMQHLFAYLRKCGFTHYTNYNINHISEFSRDAKEYVFKYYFDASCRIWQSIATASTVYFQFAEKPVLVGGIVNQNKTSISFRYSEKLDQLRIDLLITIEGVIYEPEDYRLICDMFVFIKSSNSLYMIDNFEDYQFCREFSDGFYEFQEAQREEVLSLLVPSLRRKSIELPDYLSFSESNFETKRIIKVKEFQEQYLMLQPCVSYGNTVIEVGETKDIAHSVVGNVIYAIQRNLDLEVQFLKELQGMHPNFSKQNGRTEFYLPIKDAMTKGWFVQFVQKMNKSDVEVFGIGDLKKLKVSSFDPKLRIKGSSGIDWFDLNVEISFGDEIIDIERVIKALNSSEQTVLLNDGSIGHLPESWIKRFSTLFNMSVEVKGKKLKIPKIHFMLLNEVAESIEEPLLLEEIQEKMQIIDSLEHLDLAKPSKKLSNVLRSYQTVGFKWMQQLDLLGWGGILADDMGLGKTLQIIAFLEYIIKKNKGQTSLVICPVSLVFNWEDELKKFAPKIKFYTYYGLDRKFEESHIEKYDLVITSYGLVRSDIDLFGTFDWNYVFLDESQAIKNPASLIAKAVKLLKSRNRIALSGTPIQNNTFDLYSQFNFVNPGFLGSQEFFKREFANKIDFGSDATKSELLRRMVQPFILRRTKLQVAPELPDKTEINLWFEMDREQSKIYNDYKNYYKNILLERIDTEGIASSSIYILEGLLRLRQICDSPRLLKKEEYMMEEGVKLNELCREISENLNGKKCLVFSQFTEMLGLIENRFKKEGIVYTYLDGSMTLKDRKKAVETFQNDEGTQVFLISLKAGGTGLNLTKAEYVFIFDPWWNPTVEQQAIDRSHRIGQQNKVIAYRMLCKDSVEERIVQLQQRKKHIAEELIKDEQTGVKTLSRADVEFLFS